MDTNFDSVKAHDDQEVSVSLLKKYNISSIPVTTDDSSLVGIITFDDIIDVIKEETTEDIQGWLLSGLWMSNILKRVI